MQSNAQNSKAAELELAVNDLGPLAWVLDELRKSLDSAAKALKRFVRDADAARGSDLAALDSSQLRIARQQLHQAVGALEMVGLQGPALVLRAMEAAVQKFVQQPEHCSFEAAARIERASFALTEYLQGVLSDRRVSAVSLFPQYREVQELVKADRIHPADLWPLEWRWLEPDVGMAGPPQSYDNSARSRLDQGVLKLMKGRAAQTAGDLRDLGLGLSAAQTNRQPRIFWKIVAAYFEALAHDVLEPDLYVRRTTSRILLQYASLAKGEVSISDRLAHDLLFFCAQAGPTSPADTPVLAAVRAVYGLSRFKPVNYELVQFGRFDPALLAQARKRITSAKETWSSLSAGDVNKFKSVADQFSLVTDSLAKLHPPSEPLAQALTRAVETTVRAAQSPRIELAMEVATSLLYLEAVFDDLDPSDPQLAIRTLNLAERLDGVISGGEPQPLESWMEELYSRVSDKQTMGSVVGELRVSLGELEKALDAFFRDPSDKPSLQPVPAQLSQMRGVLSVLGLDQASHAVARMRDSVEEMLVTEVDEERARAAGTFDQLGNNVGALSFLIDMLNYQPVLAKKLFVYDEEKGELKPLMGRASSLVHHVSEAAAQVPALSQEVVAAVQDAGNAASDASVSERLIALANQAALADQPALAKTAREASLAFSSSGADAASLALSALTASASPRADVAANQSISVDFEEDDLRGIFLEEAREVIGGGREAILALSDDTHSVAELTVLRRAFHTLKGSSRMVGLSEFGEAAWSLEQLLNGWLADQKPANDVFRAFCSDIFTGFENWVNAIAADRDSAWLAAPFSVAADSMRSEGRYGTLVLPVSGAASSSPMAASLIDVFDLPDLELVEPPAMDAAAPDNPEDPVPLELTSGELLASEFDLSVAEPLVEPLIAAELSDLEIIDFDFESLAAVASHPVSPEVGKAALGALPVLSEGHVAEGIAQAQDAEHEQLFAESPAQTWVAEESLASGVLLPHQMVPEPAEFVAVEHEVSVPVLEPSESGVRAEGTPQTDHHDEEQVKVIGGLRIGIPLYNVYLNEADEWSRRLVTEVAEWSMERHQPVSDSTIALAHSLAGSSATVGFHALSEIARALEGALQQSHNHHVHGAAAYGQLFVDASEDIRRLLHQFAAGFLKEPDAHLLGALRELEFNDSILPPGNQPADFDFEVKSVQDDDVKAAGGVEEAHEMQGVPEAERAGPQALVMAETDPLPDARDLAPAHALSQGDLSPVSVPGKSVPAPAGLIAPAPEVADRSALMPADFSEEGAEDIDATDAIDPELFPIFEEEASELMPQLGGALRQWSARPDNASARNEVLRALHTLKGSARLAGAMRLGEIAHRIESEIESIGSESAAAQDFEQLLGRFDAMQANFEALSRADAAAASSTAIALHAASVESSAKVEPEPEPETEAPAAAAEATSLAVADVTSDDESRSRKIAVPAPQAMVMRPLRQAAAATVRVRSQLLDRMVNQAGEVMITRSRLEAELGQLRGSLTDMSSNLNRLRQQLRDIELQAETQMQSRLAQAKEAQAGFDPLEFDRFTRVQELTRMMAESVNDVATVQRTLQRTVEATEDDLIAQARQTRELQRDLLRTRMVEFEGISDRLYRVVRQASKDTGKQVRLDLLGGTIEMDRGMLDRLTPAFEHLLRNCVAHGIEDPQGRIKAGKDPIGLITVHLRHEGNDVSVDFSDDGAGLDLGRIREKALSLGVVTADQVIGDQDASNLIFMPGFTTAAQVTELAGRGIGMDVVRSEVNSLGGRIETSTAAGQGTHFKLVLPLTTAVTQVVMIRSGDLSVGVPANVVETVRRTTAKELQQAYNTGFMDVSGETVPFFWSGALLQASRHSNEPPAKTASVVIFRSAAQRIALHVDEVLGNQEVVVKNLGPQLSRLPGLAGMSVLASGAVVLIYNPVALASVYGDQARAWSSDKAEPHMLEESSDGPVTGGVARPAIAQIPLILVVDDSITVRRVTQRLLQREGYRVSMAADGLQALERLQEEVPSVVLSDIEMPRMDGFDLARNIRADARLKGIPIIMITSRIAGKHREHAMELGVDHYLGKPYSEEELISLVRHYCAEAAVSA